MNLSSLVDLFEKIRNVENAPGLLGLVDLIHALLSPIDPEFPSQHELRVISGAAQQSYFYAEDLNTPVTNQKKEFDRRELGMFFNTLGGIDAICYYTNNWDIRDFLDLSEEMFEELITHELEQGRVLLSILDGEPAIITSFNFEERAKERRRIHYIVRAPNRSVEGGSSTWKEIDRCYSKGESGNDSLDRYLIVLRPSTASPESLLSRKEQQELAICWGKQHICHQHEFFQETGEFFYCGEEAYEKLRESLHSVQDKKYISDSVDMLISGRHSLSILLEHMGLMEAARAFADVVLLMKRGYWAQVAAREREAYHLIPFTEKRMLF